MEERVEKEMKKRIPLAKPSLGKEESRAIERVLESGMLTEGKVTVDFEKAFARYLRMKNAIVTSSCTTALDLALLALGVKHGDEVIVPDFTFPASGNVVFHVGAKPVLVDIDIRTYNMDPEKVEEAISSKTKAIIAVHLFGQSADMTRIMEVAKTHGLYVIEDAACGIGATHLRKMVGTFGDASCFSFHPRKILTTGEGGILATDDDDVAEKVRMLKNHGIRKSEKNKSCFVEPGYNFRLNDIASALGLVQLKKIASFIKERVILAKKYDRLLSDDESVRTPYVASGNNHTYQTYCIMIRDENARDRLIIELAAKGIETQIGTYALHLQPIYAENKMVERTSLRMSEAAFKNTLALPMYNGLSEEEQEYVCENLGALLRHKPQFQVDL
jgi:dTDP-4-amino-4,6-dideoxygalactose transaminase